MTPIALSSSSKHINRQSNRIQTYQCQISFCMCSFNQDSTKQHLSYSSICNVLYSIFANPFYLIIISIIHKTNTIHKTKNEWHKYVIKPTTMALLHFCKIEQKSVWWVLRKYSCKKFLKKKTWATLCILLVTFSLTWTGNCCYCSSASVL